MLAKLICKWIGHKWLFLPENGKYKTSCATCERCLERVKLVVYNEK